MNINSFNAVTVLMSSRSKLHPRWKNGRDHLVVLRLNMNTVLDDLKSHNFTSTEPDDVAAGCEWHHECRDNDDDDELQIKLKGS